MAGKSEKAISSPSSAGRQPVHKLLGASSALVLESIPGQLRAVSCTKHRFAVGDWNSLLALGTGWPNHHLVEKGVFTGGPGSPYLKYHDLPPGPPPGVLYGLSNDWAVGSSFYPFVFGVYTGYNLTAIYRRRGGNWMAVPSPNVPGPAGLGSVWGGFQWKQILFSVAGNTSRAWAVGEYGSDAYGPSQRRLVTFWDGTSWTIVDRPPIGEQDVLYAVTTAGSNTAWAVGSYLDGMSYEFKSLIEYFDGIGWSIVSSPNLPGHNIVLRAVWFSSNSDGWAAGVKLKLGGTVPLARPVILRYKSGTWSFASTPNVSGELNGLWGSGPNDVWAVGQKYGSNRPLIMHWDGNKWSVVSAPAVTDRCSLASVSGFAKNDVWAVGKRWKASGSPFKTLAVKWDGSTWKTFVSD